MKLIGENFNAQGGAFGIGSLYLKGWLYLIFCIHYL